LAAVGITYVIAGAGTFILLLFLEVTVGLRVKREVELEGMDNNEHYEAGYGEEFV
jgi:Amt family ammonium transporter